MELTICCVIARLASYLQVIDHAPWLLTKAACQASHALWPLTKAACQASVRQSTLDFPLAARQASIRRHDHSTHCRLLVAVQIAPSFLHDHSTRCRLLEELRIAPSFLKGTGLGCNSRHHKLHQYLKEAQACLHRLQPLLRYTLQCLLRRLPMHGEQKAQPA